ncbi:MAG: sortase, marine proteobacterial type [Betaproteobacteria bacterium RIFCSPLOWO2_02_FULL_62_17]|nr:MAG: sortase, marine proteobacterial type [Betaproteobacteria bacterium RIFCSPLOWO2_02_FULL_62_17]
MAVSVLLLALGGWQFGQGGYIYAKAQLAQVLIARAWERTLAGESQAKPWSWADTWPVARLTVPALKVDLYVLAGASGRTIAFGPGHMAGTPLPGAAGNSVIGGHRDTHLAFLRKVARGQELIVQRADGSKLSYRVAGAEVVDKTDTGVIVNDGGTRLTLITCYPFDALRAGGRERYVVSASIEAAKGG